MDVVRSGVLLGKTIVQVALGTSHSLALCSDGTVAAWGWNDVGQLGDNSLSVRTAPVAVDVATGRSALAGKTVVAIAAGYYHSLALCSDGTVAAWGWGPSGQLGDNSSTSRQVPVAVNVAAGTSALAGKQVVAIAAGAWHSLALCNDGTVAAWGENSGQIGDNTTTNRLVPVLVNAEAGTSALAGKTVVAVAAGGSHSLALSGDGTVTAWGNNGHGQLGDNSTIQRLVPVAVNVTAGTSELAGKSVTTIAAGGNHSLALCSDGTLAAWGNNSSGQLGDNSTAQRRIPVAVNVTTGTSALAGKTVVATTASATHSLALGSDGTLAAWGNNSSGQLGENSTTLRRVPVAVNVEAGTSALAGRQINGLPRGSSTSHHSMAMYVAAGRPTVTMSTANLAANATTLTITGTGFDASTPGNNTVVFTPTGTGTVTASTATSLTVTGLSGLSLGPLGAMVTTNGQSSGGAMQVATISAAFNAATDVPVTAASYTASGPVTFTLGFAPPVGTHLTVVKNTGLGFISGQFSNLANGATVNLTYDGTTYPFIAWYYGGEGNNDLVLLWPYTGLAAWGNNFYGQLGDGSTTHHAAPVPVWQRSALLGKTVVQVARGENHTLALCSDGAILYWGREGSSRFSSPSLPKVLEVGTSALSGKTVIAISAGAGQNLALCSDGTVAAWGSTSSPVAVNTAEGTSALFGKTVVAISSGTSHSLALCSDGTVAAWGENNYGQLGNNSQTSSPVPVAVNVANGTSALFGKTVTAISSGANFNLALCSDGTVAAWGSNVSGELGDNSLTARPMPVTVNMTSGMSALSGKTVVSITTGSSHSLALCSDGTVAAWGDNLYGQLGDNSVIDRLIPVAVNMTSDTSALSGRVVTAIAAGGLPQSGLMQ